MARITFYEKPGCGTNAKQKQLLLAAGHTLDVKSLLDEPWTAERLQPFLAGRPVSQWFNPVAPRIKSGEVQPDTLDATTAMQLLLHDHLLIRRPLLEWQAQRLQGFDLSVLQQLGVLPAATDAPGINACSHPHAEQGEPRCAP